MSAQKTKNSCAEASKPSGYIVLKAPLYPTEAQAELIGKTFGCCRYLWNQMLSDVQEFYAATDLHFIPTPAKYKKSAPFLAEVDSQALCSVHRNLRQAFLNYFRAPKAFGYPQFKTKKSQKDSFTVFCRPYRTGSSVYLTGEGVQMPKLGCVRAKLHRKPEPEWDLKSVTITRTPSGKYFASIVFKRAVSEPVPVVPAAGKTIGINHSLLHFYTDSEGNAVDVPAHITRAEEKLSRMRRRLSRMQRGSKNYAELLQKIRLQYEHIANQRKDFIHKESRRLADAWDAVCLRDTDLTRLSQQVKGSYGTYSGFGRFRDCLKYKLAQQGKPYILVEPYSLTAKTCHSCGAVYEELIGRKRQWVCPCCGASILRELNAARNIRDWGLQQFHAQNTETGAFSAVS